MTARLTFTLSEAQWDLYPEQAEGDDGTGTGWKHEVDVETPDGPWLQITYSYLRDQAGETIAYCRDGGFWIVDGLDDRVFSDVTIEFREDAAVGSGG